MAGIIYRHFRAAHRAAAADLSSWTCSEIDPIWLILSPNWLFLAVIWPLSHQIGMQSGFSAILGRFPAAKKGGTHRNGPDWGAFFLVYIGLLMLDLALFYGR